MNGKFRFRLDRVLAVREHEEDLAREGYAAQLRLESEAQEAAAAAADRIVQAGETQRAVIAAAQCGADLRAAQAWRERTERVRHETGVELSRVRTELDRAHQALVAAHQGRRALSNLRDRRLEEHRREGARREAALLDDMRPRIAGAPA